MSQPRYHEAGHTLDPANPIGDDAPRAASTSEDEADAIKTASEEHADATQAEADEAAERSQEAQERDPKPKPSELLAESGREPAASDEPEAGEDDSDGPPDGTVNEVLDWAGDDQGRIQQALNAERAGANRSSLVSELEKRQEA